MPARSTKSTLCFGLVSCDIALYRTSAEEKPPAWDKAGPNGGPLTPQDLSAAAPAKPAAPVRTSDPLADFQEIAITETPPEPRWVEDGTGAIVFKDEIRKGLRREDGSFLDLTDGLEKIAESTLLEEMRVADFIRTEEIRRERVIGSYYLAPDGPNAAKVIRLLFEAMRSEKRCAVVKWSKRTKQSLGVVVPHPATKSLMVIELAWEEDVRAIPEKMLAASQVEVSAEEIQIAVDLVQAMGSTKAVSLDAQHDDGRLLRRDLIEKAAAEETFVIAARPEVPEGAEVIELMRRGLDDREALAAAAA